MKTNNNLSASALGAAMMCDHQKTAKELPSSGSERRIVVSLPWPDSDGWWWCRQPGDGYIPGDEMCVEVTLESRFNRNFILWRGESYGMDDGTFRNMEWIKVESPWYNAEFAESYDRRGAKDLLGEAKERRAPKSCNSQTARHTLPTERERE